MPEVWKDIPRYEGFYQVSDLGNVRSLDRQVMRTNGYPLNLKGKMLATPIDKASGRRTVQLQRKGYRVSVLVAMAFLNHIPCGLDTVVHHINDNRLDDRLCNLSLVSNRYNCTISRTRKSGYRGVKRANSKVKRWTTSIILHNKDYHLGTYNTPEEASFVYEKVVELWDTTKFKLNQEYGVKA